MQTDLDDDPLPSEMIDQDLQEFVRDALPSSWLEYAEELRDAAELIWKEADEGFRLELTLDSCHQPINDPTRISKVSRTYMLLAGFALENVIKGLLVAAEPHHVNGGVLSGELRSHKISSLVFKLKEFHISDPELEFCNAVSAAIPYWGRYPIPLEKNKVSPEIGVDERRREIFLGLFKRLAHRLYWMVRDGWDSGVGPQTVSVRSSNYGDQIDPAEPLFKPKE